MLLGEEKFVTSVKRRKSRGSIHMASVMLMPESSAMEKRFGSPSKSFLSTLEINLVSLSLNHGVPHRNGHHADIVIRLV